MQGDFTQRRKGAKTQSIHDEKFILLLRTRKKSVRTRKN
jgi:hypothetical protein